MSGFARIFEIIISNFFFGKFSGKYVLIDKPFINEFCFVTLNASGSISTAIEDEQPNLFAAIDNIPDPQPKSKIVSLPWILSDNHFKQSFVVGWVPVPNAEPGSINIFAALWSIWLEPTGRIQSFSEILFGIFSFWVSKTQSRFFIFFS